MCGRYASTKNPATLAKEFHAKDATGDHEPGADFNVAPTKDVFSVVQRHPRDTEGNRDPARTERSIRIMRWGLVPKWAKDPSIGNRMINARSETVRGSAPFRTAIKYYRCLLPADGWYEWKHEAGSKQPYFMTSNDGASLALAGIWATWRDPLSGPDALPLVSFSVLTTAAVEPLIDIHERMPLVLPASAWSRWLDPDVTDVADLLVPPPVEFIGELERRPVSNAVNNVANNGAELVERVPEVGVPATARPEDLDHDSARR